MTVLAVLKRLLIVLVGTMGPLSPGDSPFQTVVVLVSCVQSRGLGVWARLAFRGLSCWFITYFCFMNSKNHNLQLNLPNSYFFLIIFISLDRA